MDFNLENNAIRYVLRRRRIKELGKSMDDLKDHLISKASISNIEKAKGNVKPDTLQIFLNKIDLTEDKLIEQAREVEEEMREVYYQLDAIEPIIEDGYLETAKRELERFKYEEYFPLTPHILFLQGRICYEEKNYDQAEKKYKNAIELIHKYRFNPKDNIIASCYYERARCKYLQHDLGQAIQYVNQGLEEYDPTKEKKGIKYRLLGNKTLYLLRSSKSDQASRLLDRVWPEVEKLDHSYDGFSLLNLYKFRSMILRDQEMYEEALHCCDKGMQIARNHRSSIRSHYLDFILISGSIYLLQKDFTKAYDRFQLALNSDSDFKSPRRHVDAHTYFGILFNYKKDWTKATYHLEKAIKIGREKPDAFRLAKALIVRGNIYYFQNQFSEAIPYYQEAAILSEKHGYKQRQHTALLKLADCFDNLNEKEKMRDCLENAYRLQKNLKIKSEAEVYELD
ncbi:tetratricopeptide repeat protein [Laceyella tengchongensis]|uniref:tetratricopeptide repeat protein n=1 Tax=Laceyella tengchongensis TaxID=574699 RepID=UPI0012B97E4D|nr:tetratricopeptide repeat protein [Laceyella tengchongensis]